MHPQETNFIDIASIKASVSKATAVLTSRNMHSITRRLIAMYAAFDKMFCFLNMPHIHTFAYKTQFWLILGGSIAAA
jgi:microcystin degradation protein MlrC